MSELVAILCALWCGPAPAAAATSGQAAATSGQAAHNAGVPAGVSAAVAAQVARLEGHRVEIASDGRSYAIVDVAGEGAPVVGVVERRGDALYLLTDAGAYRLLGPLARPRIAGPRYKVWVLGTIEGDTLRARRLGVLSPPRTAR